MQKYQRQKTATIIVATPPITPPTIGPIGVQLFGSLTCPANWFVFTQTVDAQVSQDAGISEHVCPAGHVGQLGVVSGHSTHRRKSVLRTSRAEVKSARFRSFCEPGRLPLRAMMKQSEFGSWEVACVSERRKSEWVISCALPYSFRAPMFEGNPKSIKSGTIFFVKGSARLSAWS